MAENPFAQWAPTAPAAPSETDAPLKVTVRPGDANPFAQWAPGAAPAEKPDVSQPDSEREINAITGGALRNLPVVGPALDNAVRAGAAGIRTLLPGGQSYAEERQAVDDYANQAAEAHPYLETAGGVVGNVAAMAPLGATALGARALGITGPTLAGRVGAGLASGAAIGGADTAARGGDVATGVGIGAGVGVATPLLGSALSRIATPFRITPERAANTAVLQREGVPLTAGDTTGSRPLRYAESTLGEMPGSGGVIAAVKDEQGQAFTRAALTRAGIDAPLATPDVLQAARQTLGQEFNALAARTTINYDRQMANELAQMFARYDRKLNTLQRPIVENILMDITQMGGQMPGATYQTLRSDLTNLARGAEKTDATYAGALRDIRGALDGAMERSVGVQDARAWDTVRARWGNLRTIESAMNKQGEKVAEGYLSPSHLRTAAASRETASYARGIGALSELARAGEGVLKPLPNSGTAPRSYIQHILSQNLLGAGVGSAAGGYEGGGPGAAIGGAAGFFTPGLVARALLSRPIQTYLANQRVGQGTAQGITRALTGPGQELQRPSAGR